MAVSREEHCRGCRIEQVSAHAARTEAPVGGVPVGGGTVDLSVSATPAPPIGDRWRDRRTTLCAVWLTDLRALHTLGPNASDKPRVMLTHRFVIEEFGGRIWIE